MLFWNLFLEHNDCEHRTLRTRDPSCLLNIYCIYQHIFLSRARHLTQSWKHIWQFGHIFFIPLIHCQKLVLILMSVIRKRYTFSHLNIYSIKTFRQAAGKIFFAYILSNMHSVAPHKLLDCFPWIRNKNINGFCYWLHDNLWCYSINTFPFNIEANNTDSFLSCCFVCSH